MSLSAVNVRNSSHLHHSLALYRESRNMVDRVVAILIDLSHLILSCLILSHLILSYLILCLLILSFLTLSYVFSSFLSSIHCRAFRRLLFMDDASEPSSSSLSKVVNSTAGVSADSGMARPPSRAKLQTLPFVRDLRPSVLLAYLTSCGPSQLPSPYFSVTG